jgi:hypothetical protein
MMREARPWTATRTQLAHGNHEMRSRIAAAGGIEQVMAVMDSKSTDAHTQAKACWSLVNLACSSPHNQAKIATLGGIRRIISALITHPHHEELQQEGCKCLYFLSLLSSNQLRIADAGGIEQLISIITVYLNRPRVKILEQACAALSALAINASNKAAIAAAGGVPALFRVLDEHRTVCALIEVCLLALNNLADEPLMKKQIADIASGLKWERAGAAKPAQTNERNNEALALSLTHKHTFTQTEFELFGIICLRCNDVIRSGEVYYRPAACTGGMQRVLAVLLGHKLHQGIAEQACGLICNLALSEEHQPRFASAGAIPALLGALNQFRHAAAVVVQASAALWAISHNTANQRQIAKQGGIKILLSALEKFPEEASVSETVCSALANLVSDRENHAQLVAAGGIEAVLQAMDRHTNHVGVCEEACAMLERWTKTAKVTAETAGGRGGGARRGGGVVQRILCAMERHRGYSGVQEKDCMTMYNL